MASTLRKSCATLLCAVLAEPKESENCKDDHDSTDPPYYTVHNVLLVESNIVATRFFPVSSSACCRIDEASNWPPPTLANVKEPHAIVYPTFRLNADVLAFLACEPKALSGQSTPRLSRPFETISRSAPDGRGGRPAIVRNDRASGTPSRFPFATDKIGLGTGKWPSPRTIADAVPRRARSRLR